MRETASLIDEEHHILIYGLQGLVSAEADVDVFLQRAQALIEDTREHFQNEERAMRASAFPEFECHRIEHARLLDEAAAKMSAVSARASQTECAELTSFLRNWLVRHIEREDSRFNAFLACCDGGETEQVPIAEQPAQDEVQPERVR